MMEQQTVVRQSETKTEPTSEPEPQSHDRKSGRPRGRRIFILLFILALIAAGVVVWRVFFAGPRVPPNVLRLSGRIEGDDSAVAPKTAGRILEIRVREGDTIKTGETIAVLDDQQLRAREEQASAALSEAEARTKWAQQQIGVLEQQLRQSEIQQDQAREDAEGRVRQAEADLAAAEAELAKQEAAYQIALFDRDAYSRLAETGAAAERQAKQAASTAAQQAAAVDAAKKRVEATKGALTTARASLANRGIREAQVQAVRSQIAQQLTEIKRAAANSEHARAQLAEAQANRQDLIVKAPFDGLVMTRTAEPGEVITAGTAIITLLDPGRVYLRGFVPEGQIGNVKVGQSARIYLDSDPNKAIAAEVSRIDPEATFTPENTYFQDERVKQVVGVKLLLKEANGFAKPGMPADGEILIKGDAWPANGRSR
jgi:HlyD family secretion protein